MVGLLKNAVQNRGVRLLIAPNDVQPSKKSSDESSVAVNDDRHLHPQSFEPIEPLPRKRI
jgi:hypothetical protein